MYFPNNRQAQYLLYMYFSIRIYNSIFKIYLHMSVCIIPSCLLLLIMLICFLSIMFYLYFIAYCSDSWTFMQIGKVARISLIDCSTFLYFAHHWRVIYASVCLQQKLSFSFLFQYFLN